MKSNINKFTISDCIDLVYGRSMKASTYHFNPCDVLTNVELYLSSKLKRLCGQDGREKETNGSATIFHKLGRLYREKGVADIANPDSQKRCLIKGAVLFNAALVRKPNNPKEIQDDINELCRHVCRLAGVNKKKVDLTNETSFASKEIRRMREKIKKKLSLQKSIVDPKQQKKVSDQYFVRKCEDLQKYVYRKYCKLMMKITHVCIGLKIPAPCKYALVGMGSLAKKEITPYSDFEHAIVLEDGIQKKTNYEEIVEYFRWFSVIFHLVVINVGETIVPSICLPFINNTSKKSFNWFFDAKTKKGISFDGMMKCACKFPLGREETKRRPWKTELIKPISEMLKYLETGENERSEFHLAQMLQTTCFVAGDEDIYEKFQRNVECHQTSMDTWQRLVSKDIEKFNPFETLGNLIKKREWNLKRAVYRSLGLFVEALGNVCKLKGNSSFEIIRELVQADVIDDNFGEDLLFSAAAACYLRLVRYAQKDSQSDYLAIPETTEDFSNVFNKWITVKSSVFFFKVVLKLHNFTAFKVGIIKYYEYIKLSDLHYHLHSCCLLGQFSDAADKSKKLLRELSSNIFDIICASLTLGQCGFNAYRARDYSRAKEFMTEIINCWETWKEKVSPNESRNYDNVDCPKQVTSDPSLWKQHVRMYKETMAHTFNLLGSCLFDEKLVEEALKNYERAVEIAKQITQQETTDPKVAKLLVNMGKCHLSCERPTAALLFFTNAEEIWKTNGDKSFESEIEDCHKLRIRCKKSYPNILQISPESKSQHPDAGLSHESYSASCPFRRRAETFHKRNSTPRRRKLSSCFSFIFLTSKSK